MNVVITGATKGIGRALVEKFAKEGANIAVNARTESDLFELASEMMLEHPNMEFLFKATDMSKKEEVIAFAEMVKEEWDQIDVLINNAGVFIPCPLTEEGGEEAFELMMNTNLYSTYYLTQNLLPLVKGEGAQIFNMCSIASFMPYGAYAVSKHAMLGYSRVLREELKGKGIRVTAVMPGATYTASWEGNTDLPEERFMKASDIADAVWGCYSLSPQTVVEELILRPQEGDV
jgi:short-subunit dehydrogenase